jgi:sec-independent protein translocase protein TatA
MGIPSGSEWLVILLVVVILFGGKKIPELAKGLGKGIRNFKDEMKEGSTEEHALSEQPKNAEIDKKVPATEEHTSTSTTKQA